MKKKTTEELELEVHFAETINETFPNARSVYTYSNGSGSFEIEGSDVTFDSLAVLSEKLKTKLINICAGSYARGCESCGHGESKPVEISFHEAKK